MCMGGGGGGAEREIDGCLFIYFWSAGWPLIRKNTDSNTVISLIKILYLISKGRTIREVRRGGGVSQMQTKNCGFEKNPAREKY